MKIFRSLVLSAFILLLSVTAAMADLPVEISVRPTLGFATGYTKFVMDLQGDFGTGEIGSIKSELEYPLGVTVAGIQLAVSPKGQLPSEWGFELTYLTNMNDPGKAMKDHDWANIPGVINQKIGYTESPAEMSSTQLSLEARKSLYWQKKVAIGMIGGFRYQNFKQTLIGYDGWYVSFESDPIDTIPAHGNSLALKYKVTYKMPHVGLYVRLSPVKSADFTVRGAFAAVFARDEDDHILRNRLATSDGNGRGFLGGVRGSFRPISSGAMTSLFLQADMDVVSASVKTTGDQYWYGDDPSSPENDTGTRFSGIPHNFTTRQTTFIARIGMTF